ncbi:TetR/AcrR family transcriptional regulator [Parablautia intestinalis]|uniref:TetR/AcrR family transcriptional regulator n=1 Tax=Parablautia intestinalis TaxID=2320100 RepID=A0A3A9B1Y1_9FIRM|nr:TetR/AcrR family transcriptional regulator [Parablautia intestinalis]MCI8615467.1 TetR/AcrR family transcriptional regulator [Lachnospiraceae bacterium]RKI93751.1 TetR/AcrR family transcriptional regulator [Parablautia intestinalis]
MSNPVKYDQILDALQSLLEDKDIGKISVSEIARSAGIGKGSIYYYFPSKEAILEALIERNYETTLNTAKALAGQREVSPFMRMAMLFQACRNSSKAFLRQDTKISGISTKDMLLLHQKYLNYLITELKPELALIIEQGIENGDIQFDHPAALAEIVLIVLAIKLDNSLIPSSPSEIEDTITGLISLLEKGTENPAGSLSFLIF